MLPLNNVLLPNKLNNLKLYNSFSKYTFCLIYLVIVAGGVVRMTGSGMGCPDWPKCFGLWVPPISANQINWSPNTEYNTSQMLIHNDILWVSNSKFTSTNNFVRKNWDRYKKHDYAKFNVAHTWTEYINRCIGAIAGFASLILLLIALTTNKKILVFFSVLLLFLMGFQAWMGMKVVESILSPIMITIHMLIALLILGLVLFLKQISTASKSLFTNSLLYRLLIGSLIISIVQIVLGTQVREGVDLLLKDISKSEIVTISIPIFYTHRLVAWFVLISNLLLIYIARDIKDASSHVYIISIVLFCLLGTGILMTYFAFPGLAQLLHLVCAVTLFLVQIDMLFKYHYYSIE